MKRTVALLRMAAIVYIGFSLALLAGCGDTSKATVSGKVTYKGAPVTGGTLMLYPASGTPSPININANGTFNVSDMPIGSMGVSINTDSVPATQGYSMPGMAPPKDSPAPPQLDTSNLPKKVIIPAKYNDPKTSGFTWDIKPGKNTKDFDLTD